MILATTGALTASKTAPIVYRGPYDLILPKIKEDGYRAVELHIADSKEIDRSELWSQLKANELRLTSIGTGSVYFSKGYNLTDKNVKIREACVEHLRQHMITAAPYGGVIIVGCIQGRLTAAQTEEEFASSMADSLTRLDLLAKEYGVKIGFEIMNRYESDMFTTIKKTRAFLEACNLKNTCLHVDTVHMNIEEANIGDAVRNGGKWIGHVHVADNDRWYPGHGHYDFDETLLALRDIGYSGTLAFETKYFPDSSTSGRKSLEFMRQKLQALGIPIE